MLENRKGHIVTMGSIASYLSVPGIVHYSCTKTAVNFLNDGEYDHQDGV
jgi:all-trans-retinol dehydrogenase (NAD+)